MQYVSRSALGCGVCMLIYVILTTLPPQKTSIATNWAAVAMIIPGLYEVVFAFGWLGTCWVYGPEIAPLKYRHVAGSLGAAGEWFSPFVIHGWCLEEARASTPWGPGSSSGHCCAASLLRRMCTTSVPRVSISPLVSHITLGQRSRYFAACPGARWRFLLIFLTATGKTLEEIDVLFARSPEVRERLAQDLNQRRAKTGPLRQRGSVVF